MAITHTLTFGWRNGSNSISVAKSVTSDTETNHDVTVAANTTNTESDITFTTTGLKSLYISSNTTVTLKTNNTTGAQTFTITGGAPFVWYTGSGITCPINTNVTAIFWDNAAASDAAVQVRTLQDELP